VFIGGGPCFIGWSGRNPLHPSFSQDVCYMIDWRSPPFSPIAKHFFAV
jgi:hypothetical protein